MILAGDVGGTHARFALYEGDVPVGDPVVLETSKFDTDVDVFKAALACFNSPALTTGCIAVAGPVVAGVAMLTNVNLRFTQANFTKYAEKGITLVNDIMAFGGGILSAKGQNRAIGERCFEPSQPVANATDTAALVAAGTGLGVGHLIDGRPRPSEGGHVRFTPTDAFERELVTFTEMDEAAFPKGLGPVCWEHYLSGRGVKNLYRAVCHVWGVPAESFSAEDITARGVEVIDPICHTTVETFAGMLATVCGSIAVTTFATGGVYLAGSVVRAVRPMLEDRVFQRRFEDSAWEAEFLNGIPVYVVEDDLIGLDGAAFIARNHHG